MAMVPFYTVARDRAIEETRSITVSGGGRLPPDSYGFIEFYCNDPACDCRRVIFQVWRQSTGSKVWATITYGWETAEYYAKWSHWGMGPMAREMAGSTLEQISPQTELSAAILQLFREVLQSDPAYVARLKRHYQEMCSGRGGACPSVNPSGNPSGKVMRKMRERQKMRKSRRK
jgi:hypothetical protein